MIEVTIAPNAHFMLQIKEDTLIYVGTWCVVQLRFF